MLFNSFIFWAFFACVFALYSLLQHRGQNLLLLAASYVFYGAWDWRFLSLIWFTTAVDYLAGLLIDASQTTSRRRGLLAVSVCTNLGLLGIFKYYDFFATELHSLLLQLSLPVSLPTLHVLLPAGISFYTFQSMSYTIDVYRRECKPRRNVLDFCLYVCFFPQLLAGPIERFSQLMPQVATPRVVNSACLSEGLYHILIGLFKKIVIADNMAALVEAIFSTPLTELTGFECLIGTYAFAFQIYGDFSGYSSIAQGVAKCMGFDLMFNFRMPYFAVSPSDFWQRWHISLSRWLRDYLYIPLGGNRHGELSTYRNLILTMVLGGLWHGAAWTFAIWGLFHGLLLCAYRPWEKQLQARSTTAQFGLWRLFLVAVMFHFVCLGWLFFRARDLHQATGMIQLILTDRSWLDLTTYPDKFALGWTALGEMLFFVGPLLAFELWIERSGNMLQLLRVHWSLRAFVYTYFVLMLLFFPPATQHVFIYFQF